tara:strand:- start:2 stop:376 length:375 start_codon:yes stop_codon:yes gene_type:complete
MDCKTDKLLLRITSTFKLILINILCVSILFFYSESAFSEITNIERNIALKYCDSIEKNLFKGLDDERILKYEYFFNSISTEAINNEIDNLSNFMLEVEKNCSYNLSIKELEEMSQMLKKYLSDN